MPDADTSGVLAYAEAGMTAAALVRARGEGRAADTRAILAALGRAELAAVTLVAADMTHSHLMIVARLLGEDPPARGARDALESIHAAFLHVVATGGGCDCGRCATLRAGCARTGGLA